MGFFHSIGKALFGSKPKMEQQSILTPEQTALVNNWSKYLNSQIGKGVAPYSGEEYAGSNPYFENYLNYTNPLQGNISSALTKALSGNPAYQISPETTNQIFNARVKAPAEQNWETNIIPKIEEQFAGAGALSSSGLNRALAESGRKMNTDLYSTYGNMLNNATNENASLYNSAANRALTGAGQATNINNSIFGNILRQATTEQGLQQQPLTEAYNKWQSAQPYNNPLLSALRGVNPLTPTFRNVMTGGSSGILGSAIGAAGNVLGGYLGGGGSLSGLFGGGSSGSVNVPGGYSSYVPQLFGSTYL